VSPNRRYDAGYRFERRVRQYLQEAGWLVIRSGGSRSPVDLVAFRGGEILFVQCKVGGAYGLTERTHLARVAHEVGVRAILAFRIERRIKWGEVDTTGHLTEIDL
jgi:Holliday junction resolvase